MEHDRGLAQRRSVERPRRGQPVDQHIEGNLAMIISVENDIARTAQQLDEARIVIELEP